MGSPKYPQRIRVASVFEPFDCFIVLLLILLSVVLSPLLLARSLEYPQRIRVASVFEFFVCLIVLCLIVCLFWANFLIFLLLILLFYSILLCYWPALPTIHRGLEWPQCLNCSLSVCLIVLCVSSNFLIFPSFILLFLYSTVQKSAVQYSYLFIKLSLPGPLRHLFYNKIKWKVNVCTLL